jgi:hypothetical protein
MSAQKAPAHYDGSFTLQAEVMAAHEAASPDPSRADVLQSLA